MSKQDLRTTGPVMYIEPNLVNAQQGVEIAPDLSKYSIYVNLLARIPSATSTQARNYGEDKIISMTYVSNSAEEDKVSFNQGTVLTEKGSDGTTKKTYLTTSPYDYGTWKDIFKGRNTECFGINSIDIEYNNYMIPEVTIQFTDIRGISLFAPTEELHNSNTIGEGEEETIASFFRCFFKFPYPQFMLFVKGFYGEPATYHLTVQDFRSSFDSTSGNYLVTVKFVGYQGALLGDIAANAVTVAPYTANGNAIWQANCGSKYTLTNEVGQEVPMITLVEFCTKIATVMNETKKIDYQSNLGKRTVANDEEDGALTNVGTAFDAYIRKIVSRFHDNESFSGVYDANMDYKKGIIAIYRTDRSGSSWRFSESDEENLKDELKYTWNEEGEALMTALQTYSLGNANKAVIPPPNFGTLDERANELAQRLAQYDQRSEKKLDEAASKAKETKEEDEEKQKENAEKLESAARSASPLATRDHKLLLMFKEARTPWEKDEDGYHEFSLKDGGDAPDYIKDFQPNIDRSKYTHVYVYRFSNWKKEYESRKEKLEKDANTIEDDTKREEQKQIINRLGFKPTVKNFTNIVLAHLDVLLQLIMGVRKAVESSNRSGTKFGMSNEYVGPFPLLTTQKQREEGNVNEDLWMGDIAPSEPEVQLCTDILDAVSKAASALTMSNQALAGNEEAYNAIKNGAVVPFTRVDVSSLDEKHNIFSSMKMPFKTLSSYSDKEFYDAFFQRFINVASSEKLTINDGAGVSGDYLREKATKDAANFYNVNKNAPRDFKVKLKNGGLNADRYNNFIIKNYKNVLEQKSKNGLICYTSNRIPYGAASVNDALMNPECSIEIDDLGQIKKSQPEKENDIKLVDFNKPITETTLYMEGLNYNTILVVSQKYKHLTVWSSDNGSPSLPIISFPCNVGTNYNKTPDGKKIEVETILPSEDKTFNFGKVYGGEEKDIKSFGKWQIKLTGGLNFQNTGLDGFSIHGTGERKLEDKTYGDIVLSNNDIEMLYQYVKEGTNVYVKSPDEDAYDFELHYLDEETKEADFKMGVKPIVWGESRSENYFDTFVSTLAQYYSSESSESTNDTSIVEVSGGEGISSDMKLAVYKYLKLINDRWLCYNHAYEDIWEYTKYKERWVYMDAFYNKNGNSLLVNVQHILEYITNAQNAEDMTILSFLSLIYQDTHCSLHTIHNFLDTTTMTGMQDAEKLSRIFEPVPFDKMVERPDKKASMFDLIDLAMPFQIVLYTSEYSQHLTNDPEDDGFNVSVSEQVPIAITSRSANSYRIPCFGVNYGRQYQSYFKNINVDMNTPMVTETAIRTQFMIASQNAVNSSSDGPKKINTVGQDLYTIYSNNSYTCTVKMMGCAYIQPLMYFQLNNINLFSGTYIIQKVSHHIEPGNMETTFTGVRMSKNSTKLVDEWLVSTDLEPGVSDGFQQEIDEAKVADIDNNCKYKHFSVGGDGGSVSNYEFPMDELELTCEQYVQKHGGKWNNWEFIKNDVPDFKEYKVLDTITARVYNETRYNFGDEAKRLQALSVATTMVARYVLTDGHNLTKMNGGKSHHFTQWTGILKSGSSEYNKYEYLRDLVKEVFSNPSTLVGQKTSVLEPLTIVNEGKKLGLTQSKVLTNADISRNTMWASKQYYRDTGGYHWKGFYSSQHDTSSIYGQVYVRTKEQEAWSYSTAYSPDLEANPKLKNAYEAIKKTLEYSDSLKDIELNDFKIYDNKFMMELSSKDGSGMKNAKIFDVVLNCYYDDVSGIYWMTDNADDTLAFPKSIVVSVGETVKKVAMLKGGGTLSFSERVLKVDEKSFINSNFLKSLRKRYSEDLIASKTQNWAELPNFRISKDWGKKVNEFLNDFKIADCNPPASSNSVTNFYGNNWNNFTTMGNSQNASNSMFTWNGTDTNYNPTSNSVSAFNNYDATRAADWLKTNAPGTKGSCAKWVRQAIEKGGGNTSARPVSACAYSKVLPLWGFYKIYESDSPVPMPDPQKGDIAVIAGLSNGPRRKKDLYGHIQMYDGNGGWWADYKGTRQWCYNGNGRPFQIWRWGSNTSKA